MTSEVRRIVGRREAVEGKLVEREEAENGQVPWDLRNHGDQEPVREVLVEQAVGQSEVWVDWQLSAIAVKVRRRESASELDVRQAVQQRPRRESAAATVRSAHATRRRGLARRYFSEQANRRDFRQTSEGKRKRRITAIISILCVSGPVENQAGDLQCSEWVK